MFEYLDNKYFIFSFLFVTHREVIPEKGSFNLTGTILSREKTRQARKINQEKRSFKKGNEM